MAKYRSCQESGQGRHNGHRRAFYFCDVKYPSLSACTGPGTLDSTQRNSLFVSATEDTRTRQPVNRSNEAD